MSTKAEHSKLLLILDLDETLIHATSDPQYEDWDFEVFNYKVFLRPGLDHFLKGIRNHFDVAVWSSASDDYVALITEKIFPKDYELKFVWGRSRCTRRVDYEAVEEFGYFDDNHLFYVKRLSKVKGKVPQRLEQILIVDDTPQKSRYNYGNAIYPIEFNGNPEDKELEYLLSYLLTLKDVDNVRTIEKRGWRNQFIREK